MKPEHKKYIQENINRKSIPEIAQELGLKERKIKKFLEKQKERQKASISASEQRKLIKPNILWALIALIVILGFGIYGNSLNGEFVWDDKALVEENAYITDWSGLPKIFTTGVGAGVGERYGFYRPVQMITYMLDYVLWKLNARGYHFSSVIYHILATCAILWLVTILFRDVFLALCTSVLFLIHPVHTEAVTYIAGRSDSLSLLFMLLAFILYIKTLSLRNAPFYFLMLINYTLALLSRENSLILPFLLLLYHHSFKKELKPSQFFPITGIAIIYIIIRFTLLKELLVYVAQTSTMLQRLPGFFVAIWRYLRLLCMPFHLHMEYGNKLFALSNPQALIGLLITAGLLVYIVKKRKTPSLAFFSIGWFLITLLPSSNLYPLNAYMAEHWLYLPSIGFFLILAKGLELIYQRKNFQVPAIILTISLAIFYSSLTIKQNTYWSQPLTLYNRTLQYAPDSAKAYNNLGLTYQNLNRDKEAIAAYKKAVEIKPDYAEVYINLGNAYHAQNESEKAIASLNKAIEIKPKYAEAYNNLGNVYHAINKTEEAITFYKKALQIKPDYAQAYNNLSNAYQAIDKGEQAIALYERAIAINPNYAEAYYNLGNVYRKLNKGEEAIKLYKKAIAINPNYAEAYNNLGIIYAALNKKDSAIASYKKAIANDANYAEAYNNLGLIYHTLNKSEQAIVSYQKSIQIKPDYAEAYYNLGNVYRTLNKTEQAITAYKKAIEHNLDYAEAYNNLGIAYDTLRRTEEAIAAYKKAIEVKADYAEAHNNLGVTYHSLNRTEEAIASYNKAIKVNSSYAEAYNNLSALYLQQEQYALAIEYCDKAKELGFVNPDLLQALKPHREGKIE